MMAIWRALAKKQLAQVHRAEDDFLIVCYGCSRSNLHKCTEQKTKVTKLKRARWRSNLHKCTEQKKIVLSQLLQPLLKQLAQVHRAEASW